ncbi:lytic transglycosylase domain-containing protein [Sporolactobacillus sp. STSJ-5]|uniref:lytic transglycosylase domain-containing protein n=1 Tax=Sporolactobacillus sp. STSJ-5 TaxID=2965076 RepID=UPI00272D1D8E|nr:lytic transglycosylase domain-containing protein [Sporolactobacillus sp. STSJ-5]
MSTDTNTLAQLLSMSVMSGNQIFSDQSSTSSVQMNTQNSNLFGTLLSLMMNMDSTSTSGSNGLSSLNTNLLSPAAMTSDPSLATDSSTASDQLLWQQFSSSVSPLSMKNPSSTTGGTSDYNEIIQAMSKKYSVDANLIRSVIDAESGGNPNAASAAGAQGLMQLMPGTATGLGVTNAFDPVQNIEGGTKYLRKLLDRFNGNYSLALAAYNAGSGNVEKYGGIPPFAETQAYVKKIMSKIQTANV